MKQIALRKGLFAIVDDNDFEELSKTKWYAYKNGNTFYVASHGSFGKILMHRKVVGIGASPLVVDHINGNGLDNRRENLRVCQRAQNMMNQSISKSNKSGYKGVYFKKSRKLFCAQICVNKKVMHLGLFNCPVIAAKAYDEAAKIHHGEFARLNFPA